MEEEKVYEIYTDASFDDETKIGTYAIVVIQGNNIVKVISKKCRIRLEKSTECEIFAIFQAINLILSNFLNNSKPQKFWIRTDCLSARDFFIEEKNNTRNFKQNLAIVELMKNMYKKVCQKLSQKGYGFKLRWIPRKFNKAAHNYAYAALQKVKNNNIKNDNIKNQILLIEKKSFIEILKKFNKNQIEIIIYLFNISNEENLIITTQKEIAQALNMPVSTTNYMIRQLIKLSILQKVRNGKYYLLV